MTQPKLPPISLRLPPDVLAALDVKAKAAGLTRHAALVQAAAAWVLRGEASPVVERAVVARPRPADRPKAKPWVPHPKPGKRA